MKIDRIITLVFLAIAAVNSLPALEALHKRWQDRSAPEPLPTATEPPGYREGVRQLYDDLR